MDALRVVSRRSRSRFDMSAEDAVLTALLASEDGLTITELGRVCGFSVPTVSKTVTKLTAEGEIAREGGRRRRAVVGSAYFIGVSLESRAVPRGAGGGFTFEWNLHSTLTNRSGMVEAGLETLTKITEKTYTDTTYEFVRDVLSDHIREVMAAAEGKYPIAAVGIAIGGNVNNLTSDTPNAWGTVVYSPNLGLRDEPLARDLRAAVGLPVWVDNDTNSLARFLLRTDPDRRDGTETVSRNVAVIYVDESVGGALLDDNGLFYGASGGAGEIGHLPLPKPPGSLASIEGTMWPLCTCTQHGCVASVAGYAGIEAMARANGVWIDDETTIPSLVRDAESGVPVVRAILDRAAWALSHAIVSLQCVVQPREVVVISSAFADSPFYQRRLGIHTDERTFVGSDCEIRFLKADKSVIAAGAAWGAVCLDPLRKPAKEPAL